MGERERGRGREREKGGGEREAVNRTTPENYKWVGEEGARLNLLGGGESSWKFEMKWLNEGKDLANEMMVHVVLL